MIPVSERVKIMQAYLDGKQIEWRERPSACNPSPVWQKILPAETEPNFNFVLAEYRIAEDMELKAYNMHTGGTVYSISETERKWMREIINAVKNGEIY